MLTLNIRIYSVPTIGFKRSYPAVYNFWPYNAWQHYTISIEARHKLLRHDFSAYFKHIVQSCLYL